MFVHWTASLDLGTLGCNRNFHSLFDSALRWLDRSPCHHDPGLGIALKIRAKMAARPGDVRIGVGLGLDQCVSEVRCLLTLASHFPSALGHTNL